MSDHGRYRCLHYTEAIAEAEANEEILVTVDEVLVVNQGGEAAVAIHIVGAPKFWEQYEPQAFEVELIRPRWMYGSEGHLHSIRWVGRVHDLTDEDFENLPEGHPYWELIPESGAFLWAVPKFPKFTDEPWQRCEIPWRQAFRDTGSQEAQR